MIDVLKPFFLSSKRIERESSAQKAYTIDVLRKAFILFIAWYVVIRCADHYVYARYSVDFVDDIWFATIMKVGVVGIALAYICGAIAQKLFFKACIKPFKSTKQKQRILSKYSFIIPTLLKIIEYIIFIAIFTYVVLPIVHPWISFLNIAFTTAIICYIWAIIFTYYKENRKKLYKTGGLMFGGLTVFLSLFNIYFRYWWVGTCSIFGSIVMLAYSIARCRDRVAEIKKAHRNLSQEELNVLIRRYKIVDIVEIVEWLYTIVLDILSMNFD